MPRPRRRRKRLSGSRSRDDGAAALAELVGQGEVQPARQVEAEAEDVHEDLEAGQARAGLRRGEEDHAVEAAAAHLGVPANDQAAGAVADENRPIRVGDAAPHLADQELAAARQALVVGVVEDQQRPARQFPPLAVGGEIGVEGVPRAAQAVDEHDRRLARPDPLRAASDQPAGSAVVYEQAVRRLVVEPPVALHQQPLQPKQRFILWDLLCLSIAFVVYMGKGGEAGGIERRVRVEAGVAAQVQRKQSASSFSAVV